MEIGMNYNGKVLDVIEEVKKVVVGKDICVAKIMASIIAGGNILMDDVPGVGKTTMALAFANAMGLENKRMQFTPDVLPGDITGFTMYDKAMNKFVYRPGAVMCNLFLADEINRTSPKTQSALLEVMEEGHVTVDGVTYPVPEPFIVIATENPIGSAGTQLLPDSQLDRFMVCLKLGYPSIENELDIVKGRTSANGFEEIHPVIGAAELELGVSPRGTIALTKMAKSWAYISGRDFVIPEDVQMVWKDVVRHRIILNAKARVNHITPEAVLKDIMEHVYKPTVRRRNSPKR